MLYLIHFVFIKENIGRQTLESCWLSLLCLLFFPCLFTPSHWLLFQRTKSCLQGFALKCFANTSAAV